MSVSIHSPPTAENAHMLTFRLLSFLTGYITSIILSVILLAYLFVFQTEWYNLVLDWASHVRGGVSGTGPAWLQAGMRTFLGDVQITFFVLILAFRMLIITLFHVFTPKK